MDVRIADERILVFTERVTHEVARAQAWARRAEAFGTFAKMAGLLTRAKDEDYELVYSEKRLQPFWKVVAHARSRYERLHDYDVQVAAEVKRVEIDGIEREAQGGRFRLQGRETCEEEVRRQLFVDGLSGAEDPSLSGYLDFPSAQTSAESLAALASQNTLVVLASKVRASGVVRQAVATAIGKIEADKVLEETVELEAVDLCYRPVYAFRYRRGAKEAVVEVDALTGAVKTQGSTFEEHLGKILEPKFLLDIGAEAANIFIPGATVAKLAIRKGMELHQSRRTTKTS